MSNMNWENIPFSLFAITGSVIIAFCTLTGLWITQRFENIRNARKLAYEAAISEWKTDNELYLLYREKNLRSEKTVSLQLDDYILSHLILAEELRRINISSVSADELAPIIRKGEKINITILALRGERA